MDERERKRILASIEEAWSESDIDFEITEEISDDIKIMTALINLSTNFWTNGNSKVKSNKQFCKIAVEESPYLIGELKGELLNDIDIAKAALSNKKRAAIPYIFEHMSEDVKKKIMADRKIVITELQKKDTSCSSVTKCAAEELKNDREFAKVAVKYDRDALWHLNERFRDDIEIVIEAIKCNPRVFFIVSPTLQKNKALAIFALSKGAKIFPYLDETLRGDRDVVEAAIEENGIVIEYASEELRNDPKLREKAKQTLLRQIRERSGYEYFDRDIINSNCPEKKPYFPEIRIADVAEKWIKDKSFMKEAVAIYPWLLGELYPNNLWEKEYRFGGGAPTQDSPRWEFDEELAVAAVSKRR